MSKSTNSDWKKWGKQNPYYGVFSDEKYDVGNINKQSLNEFYGSGSKNVKRVFRLIKESIGSDINFDTILDFGCGAGRLTVHFSKRAKKVIGLDVSEDIITIAKRNTKKFGINNIEYMISDGDFSNLKVDMVHSYIVLQHINPSQGYKIIDNLLNCVNSEGVACLHVTTESTASSFRKLAITIRNNFLPAHYLLNIIKGKPYNIPRMRMYTYDLAHVERLFAHNGYLDVTKQPTVHGYYSGFILVAKRSIK